MNQTTFMEEEDHEGEQSSFFALPPGIADLDDSEQALCASGEFSLEEDAEALLSSGDDLQDLNAIFTPPSKKYEALREQQGVPLLGSIWAYGSEVESEGDAKYNSAESLFSKELMPFQLRGKTSVSMGDIPHLSQAQAPEQGIDWRALSPPGSLSFSPSSPPQIEDRAKGRGVIGQPRFAPQLSPERKPNAWARPQQPQPRARSTQSSTETKQFHAPHQPGFYQIPTQPVKIHPTASSSPTGYQVLSPPRGSAPVVINPVGVAHSNYPPPAYFPTRESRPRSQSTPNNNNPNNPNTGYINYKNNNPSGFVGPQRRPYNTVNKVGYEQPQHYQQHPQQPLPPAAKGGVGAPSYGPYPFASGQPNRQGAYWQGYPAGGNNMNMGKGGNKYPNQRYPTSRNVAPSFPQPVQQQQPVQSQPLPQQQQQHQLPASSKVLREKLLENQEANPVPPPAAQKRKVKGTWKVKSKVPAEPAMQKEEKMSAVDDASVENETIVRAPVPTSDRKEVTVEHDAAAVIRQPNFLVLETKTNEATTSVQIAVAEKPPSHGGVEGAKPSGEQKSSSECSELEQDAEPIASELDPHALAEELLAEAAHDGEEGENDDYTRKGVVKATKSSATSKRRNRKGSRKKEAQSPKHLVDVLVPAAQDNLQETEPGVSHIPLQEPIAVVVKSGGGSGGAPAAHTLPLIGVQQRRKQQPKAASLVSVTGTQKQNPVNDEKGTFAWLFSSILYWIMVSAGLSMTAAESSLLLLGRLHKDAFLALLMSYNVAVSVLYIYAFPYIVSPFVPITEWAPAVMWYLFLGWFLFAKGAAATVYASTSALGLRVFLPLLFLAEGVRNPTYVMRWNGGERLMLAFVLLSLKGNHFFSKRCLLSLTVFLTINYLTGFEADMMDHQAESSVAAPANTPPEVSMSSLYSGLFQWTILVVGLSNHYQCCSSLSSPLRPRKKYLSVFRSLARKSATLAPRFKANGAVAKGHHPHAAK